jgi:predicted RecB family nuclease
VPLLVEPVRCGECPDCPWREHCSAILEDRHDPSLLPRIGYTQWRAFRDAGIDSIEALGALQAGVAVDGVSDNALEEARLNALAYLGDAPLYLRPGATVDVPRADVEVDVDMENVAAGAYLWGAYVTVRDGTPPVEPGYHSFVRWADELASDHTTEVFEEFWTWLLDLRGACWRDGRSFAAYCWFDGAENRFLRAGAADDDHAGQVETFIASHEWIDLRRWFTDHFVTGRSTSLKEVAPALGFAWSDEDPGGAMSMLWYEDATDPTSSDEQREASRQRLLAYNEDDVKATLHIRDWFEANGADVEVSLRSSGSSSRSAGTSNRTPPR